MSTDPESLQIQDSDSGEIESTPGQFLSEQREQRGLSQKAVADKLHITVHYVNAIENDAFEKLPGTIFAKGYMKRYAEILQIAEEEVLGRYENFQQAQQEHEKEVTRITRRKHQARNLNFALVSVVLFAGIFAGLWFWNTSDQSSEVMAPSAVAAAEHDVSESADFVETAEPVLVNDQQLSATDSAAPTLSQTPSPTNSVVDTSVNTQPVATTLITNTSDLNPVDSGIQTFPNSSVANERVITISNEGDDVLRVSFSDESFIQVTDVNDNRLYRGVLQSGDVLEITDSAPFDILLENAPPTRLSLNGNEIDVSDSIRIDNSARLTVGL